VNSDRRRPRPSCPPVHRVRIAAHGVPPRWHVPAQTLDLPAVSVASAIEQAVGQAQRAAGCPPWRPCRRASLPFVTAVLAERDALARVIDVDGGLLDQDTVLEQLHREPDDDQPDWRRAA
jgi:hypothetical protein